jgi:hypothetical protein
MRYLKLFESFEDINKICKKYGIYNYTINPDGSIDAKDVYLSSKGLTKLPLKFNKVNGWFTIASNELTTLEGSPKEVNGYFSCSNNRLTSFKGSPKEVNGDFWCNINELTSFEFAPKIIRGEFNCQYNNIKSFEYFPSYVKSDFYCKDNPIYEVWRLFRDLNKIELLNDFDIFRDEDTDNPGIVMDRLNDFLLTIGKDPVESVYRYKNI